MPVSTATPVKSYTGNGVTTVFAYDFRILKNTDLKVTVDGATKTLTTDYTVSGVGDSGGGNVTFVSAPANGAKIVFEGNASYDRTTDYQRGGSFDEETVDKDFDRAVILIKQLKAVLDRVPQIAAGTTLTQPSLPDPVAQRFLRWKSDLSGFENLDIATIGALAVSDFAKTYLDDADAAKTRDTLGLGTAATKDTGNAAAGNIPLNSDIQGQTLTAFTTGGTATAFTLTPTPAITANTAGIEFDVTFHTAAGATPTLAVSGLTALNLKYRDSTGAKQAVTSTQVPSGWRSKVVCDGTDWVVREIPVSNTSATQADMEAATSNTVFVTPLNFKWSPHSVKVWLYFTNSGTPTIAASLNVSSLTDDGVGITTINYTTAFSTANYGAGRGQGSEQGELATPAAGSISFRTRNAAGTLVDEAGWFMASGDQ